MNTALILKDKNLKVTPQRLAIYSFLLGSKAHPDCEEIYSNLKDDFPTMSLATVYKTVATLKSSGLLQEISLGNGVSHYDADTSFHTHLICEGCNRIYDSQTTLSINGLDNIETDSDFSVEHYQVLLYGKCKGCKG